MKQLTKEWNSIKSSKEELPKYMETYIEPYTPPSVALFFKEKSNSQPVQPQISTSSNAYENTEPVETNFPNNSNEIPDQENFLKEKDLASFKLFLENIKINGEFLTQDILNDKPLFDILRMSMLIIRTPIYSGKLVTDFTY